MTKEELDKKVDDLNDKIANYTQKLCNKIEKIQNAYIKEHCPVKVGDVYRKKECNAKIIVQQITILDDTFIIYYSHENENDLFFSAYLDKFLLYNVKE